MRNRELIYRDQVLEEAELLRIPMEHESYNDCKAVPVTAILAIPAVDAEPVRHGEWIEDGPNWVCSYCATEFKDEIEFIKLDYDYYMPHYCPHCGAKMDAKEVREHVYSSSLPVESSAGKNDGL